MLRRSLLIAALAVTTLNFPALAGPTRVQQLQDLPAPNFTVTAPDKVITKDHWAYKTLENISKKHGLLVGKPNEKFDLGKPMTRNEAAVLLVSLIGKIEQDKILLTEVEKDRLDILKQELNKEIDTLTDRVAQVESSVKTLQGSVSTIEKSNAQNLKVGFGQDFKLTGSLKVMYVGNWEKGDDKSKPHNFSIDGADLGFKGTIFPNKLNWVANFSPSRQYDSERRNMMGDVYVSTPIIPHNTFYLGQTRKPIGVEGTASDLAQKTIIKSQIARAFSDDRDVGIKVIGNYKYFDYYAGVYNGNEGYSSDNNTEMDICSWINIKPLAAFPKLGSLTLGSGYATGKLTNSWNTWGLYGAYKYKKFAVQYEFGKTKGGLLRTVDDTTTKYKPTYKNIYGQKADGWNILTSYDLTPKIQVLGRFDVYDPNEIYSGDKRYEYTIGGNYLVYKENVKLQLNAQYIDDKARRNSSRILALTQFAF